MITEKKVVLVVKNEDCLGCLNYEAIELITDASMVKDVWRRNKTPAILKKNAIEVMKLFPHVFSPDFMFDSEYFIAFCHREGFECGEFVSNQKYDTAKDSCFLCEVGKHEDIETYIYNQITINYHDMIVYESKHFYVKIEYGCLKKGMMMICPKAHIFSAASIPDDQMEEYHEVQKDIEFLLKAVYGNEPVIFFEHGSAPTGFSSHKRSIVHAHTHVAWGVTLEKKYQDMVCLNEIRDIRQLKGSKYFSYQEGSDGKLLAVSDPSVYVQRQYPRQVIGLQLGIPNELTNWRKEPFDQNMKETFDDVYKFVVSHQKFLTDRIIKATEGFIIGYPMRHS